jgi:hypothetical protein
MNLHANEPDRVQSGRLDDGCACLPPVGLKGMSVLSDSTRDVAYEVES